MRNWILTAAVLAALFSLPVEFTLHTAICDQQGDLTQVLIARTASRLPFRNLSANNVRWVVVYSDFSSSMAVEIHSLGMKCLVYVTALIDQNSGGGFWNGYTTVIPQENWAQYDPTTGKYIYSIGGTSWFSPYGLYVQQVTVPRVRWCLEQGADGVFLDTLILYPNADDNPVYAHPVWISQYPGYTYQQFRYRSLHDAAKQIYDALKAANPNAVLMISDNNICVQSAQDERLYRDKYASAIDQWQDAADGFVLEYLGFIENNNPSNPLGEAQAVINDMSRERTVYGVTKPMWILAYTNRDDVFQFLRQKSVELNFGYWSYTFLLTNYLASNPLRRIFFIFFDKKYYITDMSAFNGYGFNTGNVHQNDPGANLLAAPINFDYLLDRVNPLPNRPYVAGNLNDGSLYYIPYHGYTTYKWSISGNGYYNGYGGFLRTLPIRYDDAALSNPTSTTVLNGTNPIPSILMPSSYLAKNPLGRVYLIFNNVKYYIIDMNAFYSYGFNTSSIRVNDPGVNLPSAQLSFDYLLDGVRPLPNKPYIVGDVNDGSLYWIPYFTYLGEKYPITSMNAFNSYGFRTSDIRYDDPGILLPTSLYKLNGTNPLPIIVVT